MAKSSRIYQNEKKPKVKRDANGKFARKDEEFYGTYVDEKGYIRICAGPFRGMRLHTLIGIAMEGRRLKKDEDVNHRNGDKLNPCPLCNIEVLGHKEHGYVSAAQHQFMLRKEAHDRKEWEAIHGPLPASDLTSPQPERNHHAEGNTETQAD